MKTIEGFDVKIFTDNICAARYYFLKLYHQMIHVRANFADVIQ